MAFNVEDQTSIIAKRIAEKKPNTVSDVAHKMAREICESAFSVTKTAFGGQDLHNYKATLGNSSFTLRVNGKSWDEYYNSLVEDAIARI